MSQLKIDGSVAKSWAALVYPHLHNAGFKGNNDAIARAVTDVCYGARKSADMGYVVGPGGNWSVRLEDFMIIKGTGFRAETLVPSQNAIVNIGTGEAIMLPNITVKPSCEWPMHLALYNSRAIEEIAAVCHTHCLNAMSFATTAFNLYPSSPDFVAMLKTGKPIPKISYTFPASQELGQAVSSFTKTGFNAVLMGKHGVAVVAPNMELAFDRTQIVEDSAQYWLNVMAMLSAGGIRVTNPALRKYALSDQECAALLGSDFEKLRQQMADGIQ